MLGRVAQARVDADAIARAQDRPLDDRVHLEVFRDLRQRLPGILVAHDRRARDDAQRRDLGQPRDELVGHSVREILLRRVRREVFERQDSEGFHVRTSRGSGPRAGSGGLPEDEAHQHGRRDPRRDDPGLSPGPRQRRHRRRDAGLRRRTDRARDRAAVELAHQPPQVDRHLPRRLVTLLAVLLERLQDDVLELRRQRRFDVERRHRIAL